MEDEETLEIDDRKQPKEEAPPQLSPQCNSNITKAPKWELTLNRIIPAVLLKT
jgi:hypothetical protein